MTRHSPCAARLRSRAGRIDGELGVLKDGSTWRIFWQTRAERLS